jgi:hypothetical protein
MERRIVLMDLERAKLQNPKRKPGVVYDEEREVKNLLMQEDDQKRKEYYTVTYEYVAPFKYSNFRVELGDEIKGAEYNPDGVELDVPPYGAITFAEDEPIVGVTVIGSSCCAPGTVYLQCEPVEWKYPRTGVKFKADNLWGEHLRAYAWNAGITEQYKKCGLFSAYFSIPESRKVTIMGHGGFDIEQRDYEVNHYDAHITIRIIRVAVKKF